MLACSIGSHCGHGFRSHREPRQREVRAPELPQSISWLYAKKQSIVACLGACIALRRCKHVARQSEGGKGRGIIRSFADLPKQVALGIDLRERYIVAAPISATDGSFKKEPVRLEHLFDEEDVDANKRLVSEQVKELVSHFKWKGTVGCSVTKKACELLGVDSSCFNAMEAGAGELLEKALRGKASSVHAMVTTSAAGYNHLVWETSEDDKEWKGHVIVVATLGQNLSAVVFNDGRRVRHTRWCSFMPKQDSKENDSETCQCPPQMLEISCTRKQFEPPPLNSPAWSEWAAAVDSDLLLILQAIPNLDELLILPLHEELLENLESGIPQTLQTAQEHGCTVSLVTEGVPGERCLVRGAATCALVELEADQILSELREAPIETLLKPVSWCCSHLAPRIMRCLE